MRRLSVFEWCCAVRFGAGTAEDNKKPFVVLKDSYRYWSADPFLLERDGKCYLFFEMFDRLRRKGLLGCREISENGAGKMRIIYECPHHMSYPFIYEENGEVYIIPECSKSGEQMRLRCVEFPYKWEKDASLISGSLVDTTMLDYEGVRYYLSERVIRSGVFDRLDLFYEDGGEIKECSANPVKLDSGSARGAGRVLVRDGEYIRPSQNCGEDYGRSLNFNRITALSPDGYSEERIGTLGVEDIATDSSRRFYGIHTYNSLNGIEVIDLKVRRFNLLNLIGGVLKRLKG